MVVPLERIFSQQPLLATIRPILLDNISFEGQKRILDALAGVRNGNFIDQVLTLYVSFIEQKGLEVSEDIWEIYYALRSPVKLAAMKLSASEPQPVRYDLPYDKFVEIRENRALIVQSGQTGHRTWESSLVLTELICQKVDYFEGMDQVIELGAGTGLVSLSLAKLGLSSNITATDGSPMVIQKLEDTVRDNGLSKAIHMAHVDWTDMDTVKALPKNAVIFAGDILYGLSSLFPQIIETLLTLQPKRVIFCNPIRSEESYEVFKDFCKKSSINVKVIKSYEAQSAAETDYMFIVSVPPIRLEVIELEIPRV